MIKVQTEMLGFSVEGKNMAWEGKVKSTRHNELGMERQKAGT